jgi:hypothetical protein
MINLENLTATEAEALAYSEGFPGTARLFARIDNLQRALGQAVAALEAIAESTSDTMNARQRRGAAAEALATIDQIVNLWEIER